MKNRHEVGTLRTSAHTRKLAKAAAERYFAALAAEIPFDVAPGEVNLTEAFNEIQDAIVADWPRKLGDRDSAAHAGYLLGIEIGRRLGGAR